MKKDKYESIMEVGRRDLQKKLDTILKNSGFDREYVNKRSFFELEEELQIRHYNLYGSSNYRWGHIPLTSSSRQRIEDDIKFILKD